MAPCRVRVDCVYLCLGLVAMFTLGGESVNGGQVASPPSSSLREGEEETPLRGHLRPLGAHRPSEGFVRKVDGFLEPSSFYTDHVLPSKPVLFRRAAHQLPAFGRWSDTYLHENYGSVVIEVEHGKKEDRSGRVSHIPISQFLREYTHSDIYMVQDILPEMRGDFVVPKPLQCGGFQEVISTAVIWFSSGGTKSVLHNDDMDNINCILDGDKSIVMIDKNYQDLVEDEHYMHEKSYSLVNVESVDLTKHPLLADVPWWQAEMHKGDCLYIPIHWYHTVASSPSRNLAANLWFSHLAWFNDSNCADCCPQEAPLLTTVSVGDSIETVRHDIFNVFEGFQSVRLEDAVGVWSDLLTPATVQELFELVDTDKDLVLTWEEVFRADMMSLIREFPELVGSTNEIPEHDEL